MKLNEGLHQSVLHIWEYHYDRSGQKLQDQLDCDEKTITDIMEFGMTRDEARELLEEVKRNT